MPVDPELLEILACPLCKEEVKLVPLSEATAYGLRWAIVVGITLAVLSAIANFMFIPHHPVWALLVIALDVFVIWAIAAHGGDMRDPV